MSLGGWLIMLASVGGTVSWLAWCFYKVITTPGETGKIHGLDADPPEDSKRN